MRPDETCERAWGFLDTHTNKIAVYPPMVNRPSQWMWPPGDCRWAEMQGTRPKWGTPVTAPSEKIAGMVLNEIIHAQHLSAIGHVKLIELECRVIRIWRRVPEE